MPKADIADLLHRDLTVHEERRRKNRETMPGTAAIVDELTAAFGQVKVLHAKEGGREIGKPLDESGWTDVDKLIRYHDMHNTRMRKRP
jgi:hypothetical protein